jgi:hypothetical protein
MQPVVRRNFERTWLTERGRYSIVKWWLLYPPCRISDAKRDTEVRVDVAALDIGEDERSLPRARRSQPVH